MDWRNHRHLKSEWNREVQLLGGCCSWPHHLFYWWLLQLISSTEKSSLVRSNCAACGPHRGDATLEGSCGAELAQCCACGAVVRLPAWPLASFLSPGEIIRGGSWQQMRLSAGFSLCLWTWGEVGRQVAHQRGDSWVAHVCSELPCVV